MNAVLEWALVAVLRVYDRLRARKLERNFEAGRARYRRGR